MPTSGSRDSALGTWPTSSISHARLLYTVRAASFDKGGMSIGIDAFLIYQSIHMSYDPGKGNPKGSVVGYTPVVWPVHPIL